MTRNGKIARVPRHIRNDLNRRIDDNEQGVKLVAWLNGLDEVKNILNAEFGGRPINEQNLSDWKAGGYQDWVARQEMLELARAIGEDGQEVDEATDYELTDRIATLLAVRLAAMLKKWDGQHAEEFISKLRPLQALTTEIVRLRRSDHSLRRMKLEQQRVDILRQKTDAGQRKKFLELIQDPKITKKLTPKMTKEEAQAVLNELL